MARCPICEAEYNHRHDTQCSNCLWDFQWNDQQKIIDWVKPIWQQLQALKDRETVNPQDTSETQLQQLKSQLEERFGQLTQRVYQLENTDPQSQLSDESIKHLQSQIDTLRDTLRIEQENNRPFLDEFQKIPAKINLLDEKQSFLEGVPEKIHSLEEKQASIRRIEEEVEQLKEKQSSVAEIPNKIHSLEEKQAGMEEELQETQEQLRENGQKVTKIDEIEQKVDKLEKYLRATQQVRGSSTEETSPHAASQTIAQKTLSLEEHELVEEYNTNLGRLARQAVEVSETEKSIGDRRMGGSSTVIFEKKRRGNHLVIDKGNIKYLVPSQTLRVNEHNYKTLGALFECLDYRLGVSSEEFTLFKPAQVVVGSTPDTWELREPGILQF